jgi:hypothetical protein
VGGNALYGVAYTSDTFIAVGSSGQIWQAGVVTGCTDPNAINYNPGAAVDDGTCPLQTLVVYKTGAPPAGMGYVYADPAGISCPGTCSASFGDGVEVTLYARNVNGMEFLRYEGDCADVPRSEPCVLTMDGYKEVPVRFYPPEPRLTILKPDPLTGISESTSFSESTIGFSTSAQLGGCSTTKIILHNSSTRDLEVGMIGGIDPLEAPFSITADNCSDTTLPFLSDCTININYCPTNAGPHTDTFDCPTSDPNYPTQTMEVTGGN